MTDLFCESLEQDRPCYTTNSNLSKLEGMILFRKFMRLPRYEQSREQIKVISRLISILIVEDVYKVLFPS